MTGMKNEHSLRNKQVGEAYMLMLEIYERGRCKGLVGADLLQKIEQANPWGSTKCWPGQAWSIALSEFRKDFDLPGQ